MTEQISYATKRRIRYLEEIGIPVQIGSIIDELRALRERLGGEQAESFSAVVARIDAIKAEIPKPAVGRG